MKKIIGNFIILLALILSVYVGIYVLLIQSILNISSILEVYINGETTKIELVEITKNIIKIIAFPVISALIFGIVGGLGFILLED